MLAGNRAIQCQPYRSTEDLAPILQTFIETIERTPDEEA